MVTLVVCGASSARAQPIEVGAKSFTESAILGHMLRYLAEDAGAVTEFRSFPGSAVVFSALLAGEIDLYVEYTGTLRQELLAKLEIESDEDLLTALSKRGLALSKPIGFNNSYVMGVAGAVAEKHGLRRVSDLRTHPDLNVAVSSEFLDRGDGWSGLVDVYRLPQRARGIQHSLVYGALRTGAVDVTDLYATDPQIDALDLVPLRDDRNYFPRYDAVVLYRARLQELAPQALASMLRLEGAIDEDMMRRLNRRSEIGTDGQRVPPVVVARDAVGELFGVRGVKQPDSLLIRIAERTKEHAVLVSASMFVAVGLAVPLGAWAARSRTLAVSVLAATGIFQTIPSIALLVLLIAPFGIGAQTAIIALVLYSLLPIVRNTYAGLHGIPGELIESAEAIGLSRWQRLRWIELPLALPTILAGVKTSLIINIGTATLGGFISAGGYGQPIFTGITQNDFDRILEGALPAAVMAIAVQVAFDGLDKVVISKGLRR